MAKRTELQEQVERARRLARGMSDPADRERLQQVADHYQRQLDEEQAAASKQEVQPSADTGQTSATAANSTVADNNDVAASTETAKDSEEPTSGTSEQPRDTD